MNEKLEEYVKWVNKWYEKLRGDEAATVSTLILPYFAALGYDVNNPSEAKPQHKAEFHGMKAHTSVTVHGHHQGFGRRRAILGCRLGLAG